MMTGPNLGQRRKEAGSLDLESQHYRGEAARCVALSKDEPVEQKIA
jgi:hypothetical protein